MNEFKLFVSEANRRRVDYRASAAWTMLALFFLVLVTLAIVGLESILSA